MRSELNKRGTKPDRIDAPAGTFAQLPAGIDAVDVLVLPSIFAEAIGKSQSIRPTVVVPAIVFREPMAALLKRGNVVIISNPRPDFFKGATAILKGAGFEQPENSGFAIYAYAAVQLFASLARQARGDFKGQLLAKLGRTTASQTAIGVLTFDNNGDIRNWKFAAYGTTSGPDVCRSPQCKDYEQCKDCPK